SNRALVWVTVPLALREGRDGERVWVGASFSLLQQKDKGFAEAISSAEARARAASLKGAVGRSGLPLRSPWYVEAFSVRLPEGDVLPLPGEAFRRLVQLALVKLPFLAAEGGEALFEGRPPFNVNAVHDVHTPPGEPPPRDERLARIYPLPGGVRR